MSTIFGLYWDTNSVVDVTRLNEMAMRTSRYADGPPNVVTCKAVGMAYQPFSTHSRANLEKLPAQDAYGNLITLDGRLDNYRDLIADLGLCGDAIPDSHIVLKAFASWGEKCFSRLIGDWALALWSRADRTLYLARDHAGTRTLYYKNGPGTLQWSTYLETFFAGRPAVSLSEDFLSSYLCARPIGNLTPFAGIEAIPPGCYLAASLPNLAIRPHWEPSTKNEFHYRTSGEYEEHFLTLFTQSVERRTGAGASILAQLSGGVDSTSIVCLSDFIRRKQDASTSDLLDTVSFYNDLEPNWNERPYFLATEARRGKPGIHINMVNDSPTYEPFDLAEGFFLWPGADSGTITREVEYANQTGAQYRVILNGTGGDELLGGVPNPLPELCGYLLRGNLPLLLSQAFRWCVSGRKSLLTMLLDTAKTTELLYRRPSLELSQIAPWIRPQIQQKAAEVERDREAGFARLGKSPLAIINALTWSSIVGSLPHLNPDFRTRNEYRYPYLDRDLVDFLHRVPRRQLLHPTKRRALMRNALRDLVPSEILDRKRKAFLVRTLLLSVRNSASQIRAMFERPLIGDLGLIEPGSFRASLDSVVDGTQLQLQRSLLSTVALEIWLQSHVNTERGQHRVADFQDIARKGKERIQIRNAVTG